ncbi:hypothetical protein VSS74_00115 [Conexibacter stalactiti]|uniref:Proteasome subunit beta n=1 Tax=Conexibacter stalactiti TaxID=1940611 RepID=A0ABU4HHD1_9ACTN|nr:hypothetical protein [Conexibacter stalactiti]MDW5592718.1 hypothetical protein [Conexibacter stalactiti]MEC5033359.1 hypothetical protein [Conexibacter stalactiti]
MTILLGLRSGEGVVLAADSQRTEGAFRQRMQKLFVTRHGIGWGCAGNVAIQQDLAELLEGIERNRSPAVVKQEIVAAMRESTRRATSAIETPSRVALGAVGLFAWYGAFDGASRLLRVSSEGHAEFAQTFTAGGGPTRLALFGLGRFEHVGFAELSLDAGKVVVATVTDDVIAASAHGVAAPIQLVTVTEREQFLLQDVDVEEVESAVDAFRAHQRQFLSELTPAFAPPVIGAAASAAAAPTSPC